MILLHRVLVVLNLVDLHFFSLGLDLRALSCRLRLDRVSEGLLRRPLRRSHLSGCILCALHQSAVAKLVHLYFYALGPIEILLSYSNGLLRLQLLQLSPYRLKLVNLNLELLCEVVVFVLNGDDLVQLQLLDLLLRLGIEEAKFLLAANTHCDAWFYGRTKPLRLA